MGPFLPPTARRPHAARTPSAAAAGLSAQINSNRRNPPPSIVSSSSPPHPLPLFRRLYVRVKRLPPPCGPHFTVPTVSVPPEPRGKQGQGAGACRAEAEATGEDAGTGAGASEGTGAGREAGERAGRAVGEKWCALQSFEQLLAQLVKHRLAALSLLASFTHLPAKSLLGWVVLDGSSPAPSGPMLRRVAHEAADTKRIFFSEVTSRRSTWHRRDTTWRAHSCHPAAALPLQLARCRPQQAENDVEGFLALACAQRPHADFHSLRANAAQGRRGRRLGAADGFGSGSGAVPGEGAAEKMEKPPQVRALPESFTRPLSGQVAKRLGGLLAFRTDSDRLWHASCCRAGPKAADAKAPRLPSATVEIRYWCGGLLRSSTAHRAACLLSGCLALAGASDTLSTAQPRCNLTDVLDASEIGKKTPVRCAAPAAHLQPATRFHDARSRIFRSGASHQSNIRFSPLTQVPDGGKDWGYILRATT